MHMLDGTTLTRKAISSALRTWLRYVALAAIALILLALPGTSPDAQPVSAESGGPEMALTITEGGFCTGSDCYAEIGKDFKLGVELVDVPSNGYVLMETFIDYRRYDPAASEDGAGPGTCSDGIDNGDGNLDSFDDDCTTPSFTYTPTDDLSDEIIWPDSVVEVRGSLGPGLLDHGGITAFIPPLPVSHYVGIGVEVSMRCGPTPYDAEVSLLPDGPVAGKYGSKFVELGSGNARIFHTPKLGSITVHCVTNDGASGDTDGDGCSDLAESGTDEALGGNRDSTNPWDFYDVAGPGGEPAPDGVIDLPNDILGVIQHFSPQGAPPYDAQFDRGPSAGPNPWNMTAPDGVIDMPNDILGVIQQVGHSCA